MSDKCEHKVLAPKQHPDGPVAPACVECGKFVVRGELNIVVPLLKKANNG